MLDGRLVLEERSQQLKEAILASAASRLASRGRCIAASGSGAVRQSHRVEPPREVRVNPALVGLDAVIFLDVDGVLHTPNPKHPQLMFRRSCMELLRELIQATGAKIVLSTTWRLHEGPRQTVAAKLAEFGCPPFVSRTPNIAQFQRPKEILTWVQRYQPRTYVAIDDWPLLLEDDSLLGHFVQTKGRHGLLPESVERVKALFAKQREELGMPPSEGDAPPAPAPSALRASAPAPLLASAPAPLSPPAAAAQVLAAPSNAASAQRPGAKPAPLSARARRSRSFTRGAERRGGAGTANAPAPSAPAAARARNASLGGPRGPTPPARVSV